MPVRVQEKPKFKIKIKRNDQVVVIAGKDAGKKGRVLRVLADSDGNKTRTGVRMEGEKKVRFAKTNDMAIPEKGKKK